MLISPVRWSLPLLAMATLHADVKHVGQGQTYSTISSCIASTTNGDVCNVHAGTYTENLSFAGKSISVRANPGDTPIILGTVAFQSASNATLDGLDITAPASANYVIHSATGSGVTVTRCKVHGASKSGTGIYFRNVSNARIDHNDVYSNFTGIAIISCHSPDGTFANGCMLSQNTVHDNPEDGIEGSGDFVRIFDNTIYDNIDSRYLSLHPDGIQVLAGCPDGYCSGRHWQIYNNTIRNHTQNIFIEGTQSGATSDALDFALWNNVVYMTSETVHGVEMDALPMTNIVVKYCNTCRLYNNYIGRAGGTGIRVVDSTDGTIYIKNNIIANSMKDGISVVDGADIANGGLDHNLYHNSNNQIIWQTNFYRSLSAFRAATPAFEAHGMDVDPLTDPVPTPTLQRGSPAIGKGATLDADFIYDKQGNIRAPGKWDVGAYQAIIIEVPINAPTQLRVVVQ